MKLSLHLSFLILASTSAQTLKITPQDSEIQLQWDRQFPEKSGVPSFQEYSILSSNDLTNWTEHTFILSNESEGNGTSYFNIPLETGAQFFKLQQNLFYAHRTSTSAAPAFYEQQYDNAFKPDLTLVEFAQQSAKPACLDSIDWDPTTASFFTEYNTTPADNNATLAADDPERRIYDFTLNEDELAKFQQNGFVVSPRVEVYIPKYEEATQIAPTPVDLYYAIWTDDLPVFITADSVLDAWHQSFSSILEELDEIAVYPAIKQLVKHDWDAAFQTTIAPWQPAQATAEENAHVQDAIDLVTFYIDVAQGLLDTEVPTSSSEATEWYEAVANPDPNILTKSGLYNDRARLSQPNLYEPRGRYTRSGVLSAHFRTLIWLSRAQFHIAHSEASVTQRNRELRAAVLLALTIRDGGLMEDWTKIEKMLQGIAGQSDAMTVAEMIALLEAHSLDKLSTIASDSSLATLRSALLSSTYGIQEVNGGYYEVPLDENCSTPEIEQPRALSLFGQRWTPDSWTFQKVVYPEVRDNQGNATARRLPSGLDIAYSTLGNDTAAPILLDRMQNQEGTPFRDGYPFQENLDATRSVFDSQTEEFWNEHLYGRWIHGLRALSEPLSPSAPDTFRTEAWKRRILNTQLVSWTQLRHDTLLYAKQSFTPPILCEFPDGYVDPYPELWQRLSDIALIYEDFIDDFDYQGIFRIEDENFEPEFSPHLPTNIFTPSEGYPLSAVQTYGNIITIDRGERLAAMKSHLRNFSAKCLTLKEIAEHQLNGQSHTTEMTDFIEDTVQDFEIAGYGDDRLYNGWFPGLYFENYRQPRGEHPSSTWNPVVADVHTDGVDVCVGDLGAILHVGTGRTQFMLTAVKHPDGSACAYGGPIMSQYEFTKPLGTRLSNEEWEVTLETGEEPAFDSWKESFMVPTPSE